MRFSFVGIYRYFLTLCLIGVVGLGTALYYEKENASLVAVSKTEQVSVYASGKIVGIYEQTAGVLVVDTAIVSDENGDECCPSNGKLESGDYINSINGKKVGTKEEIIDIVSKSLGKSLKIDYTRKGKRKHTTITPIRTAEKQYAIGLWVKDDIAGIGTMTYMDENGNFGALGHGVGNGTDGDLLTVNDGCIYEMDLNGVIKGKKGVPGEINGIIYYGRKTKLGDLINNCEIGIYGKIKDEQIGEFKNDAKKYNVGRVDDIQKGTAYILSEISGEVKKYEIEILNVNKFVLDDNKGIYFNVTDDELIKMTGGIVQGMSGSPIIQNNRIIGAVTHVMVNDPTKGYGVLIEAMMNRE